MSISSNMSVYNRRRAFMNRTGSGYLHVGLYGSRESLESGDATSENGSIMSTTSTLSYKTWRKMQLKKKKARLERAHSLHGDSVDQLNTAVTMMDPFTFNPKRMSVPRMSSQKSIEETQKDCNLASSAVEGHSHDDLNKENFNNLSTILQSPPEPYYSSSDLEGLSSDDVDSEVEADEDQLKLAHFLESDEHRIARDWLMSDSFESDQNRPRADASKMLQHKMVYTKNVNESNRNYESNHFSSCTAGSGLNELTSLLTSIHQEQLQLNKAEESQEHLRMNSDDPDQVLGHDVAIDSTSFETSTVCLIQNIQELSETSINNELTLSNEQTKFCHPVGPSASNFCESQKQSEIGRSEHYMPAKLNFESETLSSNDDNSKEVFIENLETKKFFKSSPKHPKNHACNSSCSLSEEAVKSSEHIKQFNMYSENIEELRRDILESDFFQPKDIMKNDENSSQKEENLMLKDELNAVWSENEESQENHSLKSTTSDITPCDAEALSCGSIENEDAAEQKVDSTTNAPTSPISVANLNLPVSAANNSPWCCACNLL